MFTRIPKGKVDTISTGNHKKKLTIKKNMSDDKFDNDNKLFNDCLLVRITNSCIKIKYNIIEKKVPKVINAERENDNINR